MIDYLPLLVLLLIIAALLHQDAVMTLFYLVGGILLISSIWSRQAAKSIHFERIYTNRAFLKEIVSVRVIVKNLGWLPIPWVQVHESLPVHLSPGTGFRSAFSLASHGRTEFQYTIYAQKRGYYRVGPLFMRSGDLLGMSADIEIQGLPGFLIVYPRIVPFTHVSLPTQTPFGSLRHTHPAFEDPSRVTGKREYRTGDSLRRIDWKSSAASGKLQVRLFGPAVAVETMIFLDLNPENYAHPSRLDSLELAITLAASLANWVTRQKQASGLTTNGIDPLDDRRTPRPIPPRKGQGHLMHELDLLARIEPGSSLSYIDLLHRESPKLNWGASTLVITGNAGEAIFGQLFQMQRHGLNPMLLLVGPNRQTEAIRKQAAQFNIPFLDIRQESDLEVWRG